MRLDLIVNTMFKCAVCDKRIIVNNPSIWRPIVSIGDAANAYIRAIEASEKISGIFNIASGNYTVGEVADLVAAAVEEMLGIHVTLEIKHIRDFRNYKVSVQKAENVLSFHSNHNVKRIVASLVENMEEFRDWDNPLYYNIRTLKTLDAKKPAMLVAGTA